MTYTGSCLCGGIAFRVDAELEPIQLCHCAQCQKAQGGAFAAVVPVDAAHFRIDRGEALLAAYESSPGKERLFCRRCGSPVMSRRVALPGVVRIRVGLFDPPLPVRPASHAWVSEACAWWPIDDDLPRYPGPRPTGEPPCRS